jgi:flagellar biosynthesis protein
MEERRSAPRRAIALEYDGASAPRVSAQGVDEVAEQIIALAREHGVPLLENPELAGLLARLELGDEIPEALYRCVAQIIAFAYRLRGRVPADAARPPDEDWRGETVVVDWPMLPSAGPQFREP